MIRCQEFVDGLSLRVWYISITPYALCWLSAYNDPSFNELKAIYFNRLVVGGFINWYYWTSTELADGDLGLFQSEWKYTNAIHFGVTYAEAFINHVRSEFYWKKDHKFAIRAVRYF